MPYWVTMTDSFMSGWGKSKGKTNKYVVKCNTYKQAKLIEKNAKRRPEMKYVNITSRKPNYNAKRFHVSNTSYKNLGNIWKRS